MPLAIGVMPPFLLHNSLSTAHWLGSNDTLMDNEESESPAEPAAVTDAPVVSRNGLVHPLFFAKLLLCLLVNLDSDFGDATLVGKPFNFLPGSRTHEKGNFL